MPAPESHKGIVLVADDNEANRELLSAQLNAEGYRVVCASDGQQAIARVGSDAIDCRAAGRGNAPSKPVSKFVKQ